MLISKVLNDGINAQIGHELQASHQYVAVATYFDSQSLPKLAQYFYKQAEEEREHAMKFVKYVVDAGGTVVIPAVAAPQSSFASAEAVFEMAVNWEMEVTHNIYALMDIAVKEKDYIAQQFLNWYTNEQLEEVSSMEQLLRIVKRAGERNLIMLEAYLIHANED